jgi:hypothetical protein
MMTRKKVAILLVVLALAGCQANSGMRSFAFNKITTPTNPIKLDFMTSLNPDCTATGPIEVRVITPPSNGTLQVNKTESYPLYAAGNQRYHCNGRKVPGVLTVYTPRRDFFGQDTVVTETFPPSGVARRQTFNVTVR